MTLEYQYFYAPLVSICLGASILLTLLRFPHFLVDHPNQRSLHDKPVPRTGGIAIASGILVSTGLFLPQFAVFTISALLIAILSLADDWRQLKPLTRFGTQGLIVVAFCVFGLDRLTIANYVFLVLAIVWVANLYNFMDGSDGLAGGMAVIGFSACALGAYIGDSIPLAILCSLIATATLPFLALNFHPARVFMGDVGAVTLGFSAAAIGAIGWREGIWSPFFPVFVFSPFIADSSLTLLHRILRKEKFWRPHREHYYQKLIQMGLGHRNTALLEYAVMLASSVFGIASFYIDGEKQLVAIVVWGSVLMLFASRIDRKWSAFNEVPQ